MGGRVEIVYRRGTMSPEGLEAELRRLWAELGTNEELRAEISQVEIDPDELKREYDALPFEVRSDSAGFDPVSVVIVAAGVVAKDLWEQVLLPRIRARYGADAVRGEGSTPDDSEGLPGD